MINHWQQLLPVDAYRVATKGMLSEYDRKIIAMLYQPLIGPISISLYMTLWSELESNRVCSQESNHYGLMNILGLPLNEIYEARKKLEGIGLLRVYKKKVDGESASFLYELMAPLNPEQFFTDGMLNIYLYKKVGKAHFAKLKRFFSDENIKSDGYEECTKSFTDVFTSEHMDSLYISDEAKADLEAGEGQVFVSSQEAQELEGFMEHFDFGLFFAGIKSAFLPEEAFTKEVQTAIAKLAFIYGINPIAMQSVVMSAVNNNNEIDIEELRKSARNWYQIEYNSEYPSLSDQVQPAKYRTEASDKPLTKEEERIQHLEQVSPRELLIQHSGGGEPSRADLQIIEEVMLKQKLTPGVMNVLLEYVMIMTDMKLSKSYIEKIAGHWARKNVKTVKEAMELAKKEYKQAQNRTTKSNVKNTGGNTNKKIVRTEIVPEWLKNNESKAQKADSGQNTKEDKEFLERKQKLQEKLKEKYKKKG
ncbi:replication initiation and membrane attachment family protein [Bacillus sp. AGMB 02131]|uniref:Replication initiation and membrane attachment family protein n=1 Tax=Peribacillus faecalis TaxID=2772559 RepID=A0A927HBC3_9BACI|nr:replication initiation and membrane attachment family protein [Peribacillus faecalis]MBD3108351.1 replication initiation and membrane attachment family protein [Peribacillus faecalis]